MIRRLLTAALALVLATPAVAQIDPAARGLAVQAKASAATASVKARLIAASLSADVSNPFANAASTTNATITSPASAPSTTGFTNLLPANTGYAGNFQAATVAGSAVVQGNSISAAFTNGWLVEDTSGTNEPNCIPLGARVVSVNTTTNQVTMDRAALATCSSQFLAHVAPGNIEYLGGVPASYGGNLSVSGATSGNSVAPATAPKVYFGGYAVEFMVDAANVTTASAGLMWKIYPNGVSPATYRVAIDDVYNSADPVTYGASNFGVVTFPSAGVHKVRIEFQGGMMLQGLYVVNGGSVWLPPSKPRMAMLSDSYFQGGAAGSWQPRNLGFDLAARMGWYADMLAVGGTGYCNAGTNYVFGNAYRIADLARRSYAGIVISGSVNDPGCIITFGTAGVLSTFKAVRAAAPTVPIFIFGVTPTIGLSQASAGQTEAVLQSAFAQWQAAGERNAFFIPNANDPEGAWITSANQGLNINASDNTHPTDKVGTSFFSSRFAAKLKPLLPALPQ